MCYFVHVCKYRIFCVSVDVLCETAELIEGRPVFRAATTEEIQKTGVTVASLFFGNVFGAQAQKALTVFVALR